MTSSSQYRCEACEAVETSNELFAREGCSGKSPCLLPRSASTVPRQYHSVFAIFLLLTKRMWMLVQMILLEPSGATPAHCVNWEAWNLFQRTLRCRGSACRCLGGRCEGAEGRRQFLAKVMAHGHQVLAEREGCDHATNTAISDEVRRRRHGAVAVNHAHIISCHLDFAGHGGGCCGQVPLKRCRHHRHEKVRNGGAAARAKNWGPHLDSIDAFVCGGQVSASAPAPASRGQDSIKRRLPSPFEVTYVFLLSLMESREGSGRVWRVACGVHFCWWCTFDRRVPAMQAQDYAAGY